MLYFSYRPVVFFLVLKTFLKKLPVFEISTSFSLSTLEATVT